MTVSEVIGTLPPLHFTDIGNGMRDGWEGGAASALCSSRTAVDKAIQKRTIMILSAGEVLLCAYVRTIP